MRTLIGTLVGLAVFAAVVMLSLFVGSGGIGEMELAVITVIGALMATWWLAGSCAPSRGGFRGCAVEHGP